RLDAGDVLIIDGAMGTELERRGAEMDGAAWAGTAMKSQPEMNGAIHRDFIEAGADIIIANTYASAPHVLRHAGVDESEARELNRLGCAIAHEAVRVSAADREVYVAGSLSSFRAGLHLDTLPSEAEGRASYRAQAEALAEGGCDLLIAEMMLDPVISPWAIEAAVATGLPVWIGLSARVTDGRVMGFHQYADDPFETVLDACLAFGGQAAGIMHSDIDVMAPALAALKARWDGPLFAYPHSGHFEMPHWRFDCVITPEDYVTKARGYLGMGAQAVGGCCGLGPEHIRLLKQKLPTRGTAK
ncbi:MAG: homocysteine S-methyltransferase family protein, partial [Rhodospirillaceae bacterium]|nr:homocysteine S-methyltransferase family protein [Rhodospirillaceae bacterium]